MIRTEADMRQEARQRLQGRLPHGMFTFDQAAAIATLVYETTEAPSAWLVDDFSLVATSFENANGFDGLAAFHALSRTLVMASRGVEGLGDEADVKAAAQLYRGAGPGSPMDTAVDLVVSARRSVGAVAAIACVGHSMGAGLAEGQCALARAALAQAGAPFDGDIWGAGFGSAGFGATVAKLAARRNLAVEPDIALKMVHHVRSADAVWRNAGQRRLLGARRLCAQVWRWKSAQNQQGDPGFAPDADGFGNHVMATYSAYFQRSVRDYVMKRSQGYELREGRRPPARWRPAIPEEDR